MMIQRVRLQRKFTLRSTIDPKERAAQIAQMMVLFELVFISLSALLSFSPHFHLQHVIICSSSCLPPNSGLLNQYPIQI